MGGIIEVRRFSAAAASPETIRRAYRSLTPAARLALERLHDPREADIRALLRTEAAARSRRALTSVSHAGEAGVLAVGLGVTALGADLEPLAPADPEAAGIVATFSDPRTARRFSTLVGAVRDRVFLRLWTVREAFAKALGTGLIRPGPFDAMRFDDEFRPQVPDWRFACSEDGRETIALAWRASGPVEVRAAPGISHFTSLG